MKLPTKIALLDICVTIFNYIHVWQRQKQNRYRLIINCFTDPVETDFHEISWNISIWNVMKNFITSWNDFRQGIVWREYLTPNLDVIFIHMNCFVMVHTFHYLKKSYKVQQAVCTLQYITMASTQTLLYFNHMSNLALPLHPSALPNSWLQQWRRLCKGGNVTVNLGCNLAPPFCPLVVRTMLTMVTRSLVNFSTQAAAPDA
jgi:hypothetical protein